jgi:hypothetical protein
MITKLKKKQRAAKPLMNERMNTLARKQGGP